MLNRWSKKTSVKVKAKKKIETLSNHSQQFHLARFDLNIALPESDRRDRATFVKSWTPRRVTPWLWLAPSSEFRKSLCRVPLCRVPLVLPRRANSGSAAWASKLKRVDHDLGGSGNEMALILFLLSPLRGSVFMAMGRTLLERPSWCRNWHPFAIVNFVT